MKQVWKIDENGYFTGESYFVDETTKDYVESELEITEPYTIGYVKGKWNGSEWKEGATAGEIQAWHETNRTPKTQPTETEILQQAIAELSIVAAQNQQSIAELSILAMGGGAADVQ